MKSFYLYLAVMAGITYIIRMIPLVGVKKKIKNKFLVSFLYYVPYAVLSVMTIPAIFYSTTSKVSAIIGFISALIASYFNKSLLFVAVISCITVYVSEYIIMML